MKFSLRALLNRLSQRSPRKRGRVRLQPTARPQLECLEDRVVPTTHTWTGGSIFSNHWSDQFNWQNGVPQEGDSVFFPANAKQRTNVQDIRERAWQACWASSVCPKS